MIRGAALAGADNPTLSVNRQTPCPTAASINCQNDFHMFINQPAEQVQALVLFGVISWIAFGTGNTRIDPLNHTK
ncbi:MAG: hypothetical protein M3Q91_09650 [Acidobacteriota bacterium]|nr:hypothetical protein [Acidobacteriota bacterium]